MKSDERTGAVIVYKVEKTKTVAKNMEYGWTPIVSIELCFPTYSRSETIEIVKKKKN